MINKKNILLTAAVAGLIAGITVPHAHAGDHAAATGEHKDGCNGKDKCNGKDHCKGKDHCDGKKEHHDGAKVEDGTEHGKAHSH